MRETGYIIVRYLDNLKENDVECISIEQTYPMTPEEEANYQL